MYKILVVDDEEGIRRLISKYAVFEGHEITEAADGMEAIRILRNEKFDIAVSRSALHLIRRGHT